MARSLIGITPGTGANVDTVTVENGNHRQIMSIGGDAVGVNIAPVDAVAGLTVNVVPAASGGSIPHHLVAATGTNPTQVKTSAGQVSGIDVSNKSDIMYYIKFHNTNGAPVAGSTAVYRCIGIQAGTARYIPIPANFFSSGIAYTITKEPIDTGTVTGVVTAGDVTVDTDYR